MTDKKAQALENLGKVSRQIVDDVLGQHPNPLKLFGHLSTVIDSVVALSVDTDVEETERPDLTSFQARVQDLVNRIEFWGWSIRDRGNKSIAHIVEVELDQKSGDRVYIQVRKWRPDALTDVWGWGNGGKRYLSEHMTDSEIVRLIFNALLSYEEHEIREGFTFDGAQVFGPHIDVAELVKVAGTLDIRRNDG